MDIIPSQDTMTLVTFVAQIIAIACGLLMLQEHFKKIHSRRQERQYKKIDMSPTASGVSYE